MLLACALLFGDPSHLPDSNGQGLRKKGEFGMAILSNHSRNELSGLGLFFREIFQSRRFMGAAAPSGPILGKAMASKVPSLQNGEVVVELGAGTGAITRQLINSGLKGDQLVSVERSPAMSTHLRKTFPGLRVLEGDAGELRELLKQHLGLSPDSVASIVSGLPLKSLPSSVVDAIVREVHATLSPGGRFIQFTYDIRPRKNPVLAIFKRQETRVIWANFPPARVDVYERV